MQQCYHSPKANYYLITWVTPHLSKTSTGPAEPVQSVRPWPDQLFGKIIKFCQNP